MGAWIEIITSLTFGNVTGVSHPTMGAWIEIELWLVVSPDTYVAPHDGCVD